MRAWQIVVAYESKLVKRNWLFRLFIVGVLGYILVSLVPWDIRREIWRNIAFASSLPTRGVYFLNLFQSLVVVLLTCDMQRKRNKAESREILSVKPLSNSQFFWAELAGMALPFLIADGVFMAFCLFIHLMIPDSPVNPWVYLSFLLKDVLPTFVFVTGLSLLANRILRHPFVSWLVLTVFLCTSYAYLTKPLHGILDFRGSLLPESFSSIVGFMHSDVCLLQRGMFLLLGLGLLCVAVPFTRRLSEMPGRKVFYHAAGCLLLMSAVGTGYVYIDKFQTRRENREAYREVFSRYEAYPKMRIATHDITYKPKGETFSATSRMTVVNRKAERMEQLILFLNPGLEISKLKSGEEKVPFRRDRQAVVVERSLAPGDSVVLEIDYGGCIDEDIYQVDIDEEDYFAPERPLTKVDRYGKRAAFVSGDYTLLIPEVLWYPAAVAPVALQPSRETNFTDYTLRVKNPGRQVVLSQGIPEEVEDEVRFRSLQSLTGLSLCMGDYVKRSVTADSITVEFYTYPGNDFYLKPFDGWMDEIAKYPNATEYRKELVNKCRNRIEGSMPNPYPFRFLKLVEAPSSFLYQHSFHNNIQPEMAFFGERMLEESYKPGAPSVDRLRDMNKQEYLLFNDFPFFLDDIHADRLFSDFHWSVASDRYAGIDMLFGKMANPSLDKLILFPSMLDSITKGGLEGLIRRGYSRGYDKLISMKVSQLLAYLTTITGWDSLRAYTREFYESARFREVDFDLFMEGFRERFGRDIRPFVDDWYTTREIPRLVIKDLTYRQTGEVQAVDFKVGNTGEVDGCVSVIEAFSDDYGRWIIGDWRSFPVKPGEYKRIVAHEVNGYSFFLSTNFSRRVPERIEFHGTSLWKGDIPAERVVPLDKNQFYPPGEIIVDNEDEGFHLIDSSGNRLKRLAEQLAEDNMKDYNYGINAKKHTWGKPCIEVEFYGEEVHSAFTKVAGNGSFKAEWIANLPEAGRYEIFVYLPDVRDGDALYRYESKYPGMKHHYTVYTPGGSKEVVREVTEEDADWVFLGTFVLPAGESRVVLDDRGVPPFDDDEEYTQAVVSIGGDKHAQLVVADAVKWVKVK
ncbi:hypothetical protein [Sanguibacteroides justesenii]|uniref:Golvesin/Xly CBD-like domain-containing protein n=1 Tax=Sanguibacteroides justesenii TaxID=1547597 RepID=A0AB34R1A4_9PORP|nr:hypothetical protein [Sanguibacteroides justesenii]KIO43605.1 hypothetical protein IE90_10820 [Sanguibacteroides justesenii]